MRPANPAPAPFDGVPAKKSRDSARGVSALNDSEAGSSKPAYTIADDYENGVFTEASLTPPPVTGSHTGASLTSVLNRGCNRYPPAHGASNAYCPSTPCADQTSPMFTYGRRQGSSDAK
jgi:hypothetical protein